jgi:uncharacterized protein (TIGR00645 family)
MTEGNSPFLGLGFLRVFAMSRWLLLPIYVGLILVLLALAYRFALELIRLVGFLGEPKEARFLASVLSLVEFALVAHLVYQVASAGYRNFIARESRAEGEQLAWATRLSASALKMRVIASVIAIATVELLKVFIDIDAISEKELMWSLIIYGAFLVGGLGSAAIDLVAGRAERNEETSD